MKGCVEGVERSTVLRLELSQELTTQSTLIDGVLHLKCVSSLKCEGPKSPLRSQQRDRCRTHTPQAESLDPKHNLHPEELVVVQPSRDGDDGIRIIKTLGERKGFQAQVDFRLA